MFLVLQIPLVDGRRFKVDDVTRVDRPDWSGAQAVGRQFLRGMGVLQQRRGGYVDGWSAEGFYCDAANWLRYPTGVPIELALKSGGIAKLVPAFRRWMGDARVVYRLELGWRIKLTPHGGAADQIVREVVERLGVTELSVGPAKSRRKVRIADLADRAYRAFVDALENRKEPPNPLARDLISQGQTLLYLEFRANEVTGLPQERNWQPVPVDPAFGPGFSLAAAQTTMGRQSVAFYCVRRDGVAGDDHKVLRSIRLNILRMHAEMQGLEEYLRWRRDPQLARIVSGATDRVNEYLQEALKRLRPDRGSKADSRGFRMARHAVELGSDGRIDTLLEDVIARLEDPNQKLIGTIQALQLGELPPNLKLEVDMSTNKTVNKNVFGANATGLAIAQGGAGSTNTATSNYTIEKFNEARAEVAKAVNDVVATLPDGEQKLELKLRLKDLQKEGQERPWYSVTAQGLKEAAEAIGGAAGPIVAAATKLLLVLA